MQNNESSVGPVVGTIIILAIIVVGGLYFWGQHKAAVAPTQEDTSALDAQTVNQIQTQSSSDDTTSIQQDLQNTNTSVDTELQAS